MLLVMVPGGYGRQLQSTKITSQCKDMHSGLCIMGAALGQEQVGGGKKKLTPGGLIEKKNNPQLAAHFTMTWAGMHTRR
jgi:hypothetical protein